MNMIIRSKQSVLAVALALCAIAVGTDAMAVPPAWVTSSITDANTVFTEYLAAAAPEVMKAVAGLAGLILVINLVRRAIKG